MRYLNETAIATVSGLTNPASSAVMASYLVSTSAQLVATGTIAGTLKLQGCNDAKAAANWSDIANATVAVSSAGVYLIPKTEICYNFIRVVFTSSGGAGNVTVNLQALGF
jgi:hypothetical protein